MTRESDQFISFSQEELRFLTVRSRQCHYDLYVASAAAPAAARGSLYLILCVAHELERALEVTSEPLLAMIRLTWWREAIEEIVSGKRPRDHELVIPLAKLLEWKPELAHRLFAMIEAHAMELEPEQWSDHVVWEEYLTCSFGNIIALWCEVLGAKEAADVGAAFALIHIMCTLPRQQQAGHLRIPLQWQQELEENGFSEGANQSIYGLSAPLNRLAGELKKVRNSNSRININKSICMIVLSRINKAVVSRSHVRIAGGGQLPFSIYIKLLLMCT